MKSTTIIVLLSLISLSFATVYFQENFDDASWKTRWVVSENKENLGAWEITSHPDDETNNKGLATSEDYRFYQISSKFDSFSNKDETLVIQLSVAFPQRIDCGGGYIKLLPAGFDQKDFSGDSKYFVMFGPDICGSNKRTHAIINYKGENVEGSKSLKCDSDINTGVYTFIINPDQTYSILLDNVEISSGNIVDQWNVLPEKKINDPSQSKPKDWVDDEFIADPAATKPEGYDDIPAFIADPDATKPDDWDTELDGDWEAPLISNPEFQGPWEAPLIKNPEYKGEWEHPQIDNPDYAYDENIYLFKDIGGVGIEIWQVKSGTIFDNILITNDVTLAKTEAERIVKQRNDEIAHAKKVQEEEAAREEAEADRISEEFGEEEEEEEEAHVHEEL